MSNDDSYMQVPPPHSNEWTAKRRVSVALRNFIEVVLTSTPPVDELNSIAEQLENASNRFSLFRRVYGRHEWIEKGDFPTFAHVFHETNILTGASNPFGPAVETWMEADRYYGKVNVGWAYEGPPGCVHGGILAAIFDHFFGTAQLPLSGQIGMTRYLNVSYHKPTPLNKDLKLVAWLKEKEGRKTFISGEIYDGEILTASCEALFIQTFNVNSNND